MRAWSLCRALVWEAQSMWVAPLEELFNSFFWSFSDKKSGFLHPGCARIWFAAAPLRTAVSEIGC